jgi:hypothetical protein
MEKVSSFGGSTVFVVRPFVTEVVNRTVWNTPIAKQIKQQNHDGALHTHYT